MAHIFTGTINTNGEFVLMESAIGKTFTASNVYTIQFLQPAYIRWGNQVAGGNLIDSPRTFVEYTDDGTTDLYIKTTGNVSTIVSEKITS